MKSKEKFKVYQDVFDTSTIAVLSKFMDQKIFDKLEGIIASGKESNVFLAKKGEKNLAVKIYLYETSNFRNMWKYIEGDARFLGIQKTRRSIIHAWAKKEYSNLQKMSRAKISVPKPIVFRNNVLIMKFIGTGNAAAPRARDKHPKNPEKWFKEVLRYIKKMYNEEGTIHGDLSEYNILNYREKPVIIDVSQSVLKAHPLSDVLLKKDITTVCKWFKKLGVDTPEVEDIYNDIKKEDNK